MAHRIQLSWNIWDSPGFGASVLSFTTIAVPMCWRKLFMLQDNKSWYKNFALWLLPSRVKAMEISIILFSCRPPHALNRDASSCHSLHVTWQYKWHHNHRTLTLHLRVLLSYIVICEYLAISAFWASNIITSCPHPFFFFSKYIVGNARVVLTTTACYQLQPMTIIQYVWLNYHSSGQQYPITALPLHCTYACTSKLKSTTR